MPALRDALSEPPYPVVPNSRDLNTVSRFTAPTTSEVVYVGMTSADDLLVSLVADGRCTTFRRFAC